MVNFARLFKFINMKDYFRRIAKYVGFILIIIVLLLSPQLLSGNTRAGDFFNLILANRRLQLFLIIFIAYSFVYPLMIYDKKERYINGSFSDNKEGFIKSFAEFNFKLSAEEEKKLVFRKKSVSL